MMLRSLFVVLILAAAAQANLIRNGNFAASADKPAEWSVVTTEQKVTIEKVDDKTAMRVDIIKENGKSLGEIRQTIKIKPKSKYRFTADIKSTKDKQAMIMLKPRVAKKEGERINTDFAPANQWTTVTKEFDSGDADEVQVLCRFSQKADAVGGTHWFTNLKLQRLDGEGKPIEEAAAAVAKPEPAKPAVTAKVAADGADQYVTAAGAGDKSGKDWANARDAAALQAALDAAGPGNTVYVGSGEYKAAALTFAAGGGREGATKILSGKDTGSGLPVFKGAWTKTNPEKSGGTFITVPPGVSHVAIRDLKVNNVRTAVALKGPNAHVDITNVDVTEGRDPFWIQGAAVAGDDSSYSSDIQVKDCDILHYTKKGLRIFDGVRRVQITNCHADAGGKEWAVEVFPNGFHVNGGDNGVVDSDITFTDCTGSGNYHQPAEGKSYWNADGYAAEGATRNLTFIRCRAFNNTDGGWDLKTQGVKMVDCIGVGNKRNFRIWTKTGDGKAVLENCLSAYSYNPGKNDHDCGFWFLYGGEVEMTNCTSYGDRLGLKVEGKEGGEPKTTQLTLTNCVLIPKADGKDRSLAAGTDVKEAGTVATAELTAPKEDWRGGDTAFDVKNHPDVGYRFKK
jgi:hypothetical protein